VVVAFFSHFFLPIVEPEVAAANAEKIGIENEILIRQSYIVELTYCYRKGVLSLTDFNQKYDSNYEGLAVLRPRLQKSEANYRAVREAYRVCGFPSRHKFMWSFGIGLIISMAAIKLIGRLNLINDKNERISESIFSIIIGTIGGYFFAWIFYPEPDLSYEYYMAILITLGFLGSLSGFFLSRAVKTKTQKIALLETILQTKMKIDRTKSTPQNKKANVGQSL